MHKKKTSTKKNEKSPTFNEAMIFNIPAHSLQVNYIFKSYKDILSIEIK